jgi:hypothetical protein
MLPRACAVLPLGSRREVCWKRSRPVHLLCEEVWVFRSGMAGRPKSFTASLHRRFVLQPQPLHTGDTKPWSSPRQLE